MIHADLALYNIREQKDPPEDLYLAVLSAMDTSYFDFFLTGSRYFNRGKEINDGTDYDYFTVASVVVINFLMGLGFVFLRQFDDGFLSYDDPSIDNVMRFTNSGYQIDVQLVFPNFLDAKKRTQRDIEDLLDGNYSFLNDKEFARRLWNMLIMKNHYI